MSSSSSSSSTSTSPRCRRWFRAEPARNFHPPSRVAGYDPWNFTGVSGNTSLTIERFNTSSSARHPVTIVSHAATASSLISDPGISPDLHSVTGRPRLDSSSGSTTGRITGVTNSPTFLTLYCRDRWARFREVSSRGDTLPTYDISSTDNLSDNR